MSVKYPSVGFDVQDTSNAAFAGTTFTTAATTYSKWYNAGDCDYIGLAVAVGTVTGTSPGMTCSLEARLDENANIYPLPAVAGAAPAAAALPSHSTTGNNRMAFFPVQLPASGKVAQFRVAFTVAGTSPVFPLEQVVAYKVASN